MKEIRQQLLETVADMHSLPIGAFNIRENGESIKRNTTENIDIITKKDKSGIDIKIKDNTKNQSVHIPVIITKAGINDLTYNNFYIGENCDVVIVAGCGIHNDGNKSSHNGIHSFFIGKNSKVKYVERHFASGKGTEKVLNPTTKIVLEENSELLMETHQLGGVSYSNRKTNAKIKKNAKLIIKEKILTEENQICYTDFKVELNKENSKCEIISRSVAKDNSIQVFKSKLIGNDSCFGRVECDGILLNNAKIQSSPIVVANSVNANLSHEATVGKIAGEELVKLMTLGLTEKQAEDVIIQGYLR